MRRTILFWLVLAVPSIAGAFTLLPQSGPVPYVCTKNGRQIRATDCVAASPKPTATPGPTIAPLPCEDIGGIKNYQLGETKLLCFRMPADPAHAFVEVSVRNYGNSSCGTLEATLTNPAGQSNYSEGPQPNTVVARGNGGLFYLTTRLLDGCAVYGFTPR